MGRMSTEKRLQLIRLIRDDHAKNMGQLRKREEIVYDIPASRRGRSSYEEKEVGLQSADIPAGEEYVRPPSTFKLRVIISILIGVGVYYLEVQEQHIYGITAETVTESIRKEDEIHKLALELEHLLVDVESLKRNP
ncbi:MAG: hypothetical protein R3Y54_09950 [Eubacteriales bacterium]